MEIPTLILIVVIALLVVFWVVQFAQLMTLSDDYFPGKYDKILWVVAFVLMNVLAAFAFLWWKTILVALRKVEREEPPGKT
jgi:hypothetical protein